mgnify:CR=1 FL=1
MSVVRESAAASAPEAEAVSAVADSEIADDAIRVVAGGTASRWAIGIAVTVAGLSLSLALFQLFLGYFPSPGAHLQRMTHVSFVLVLAFLLFPLGRNSWRDPPNLLFAIDLLLIAGVLLLQAWVTWDHQAFLLKDGNLQPIDHWYFGLFLVVLIEATRRAVGLPLALVAIFFLFHTLYADLFSFLGPFYGPPTSWDWLTQSQVIQTAGILGLPIYVMTAYVSLFIIFAVFLVRFGTGQLFIDLAYGMMGSQAGGPAKVAVVASSLFATVSGSTVANVVGTGSITIPLMKRVGYSARFAGAVEAAASTGGQIMPPIMGAVAFVMAEYMGVSYAAVILAALVPAILFFVALFSQVHFEAKRLGLQGMPREELPSVRGVLRERGYLLLPLIVLVGSMFYYSVVKAALFGLVAILVVIFLRKSTRPSALDFLAALERAARMIVPVSVACAAAGLIIGCIAVSGLGIRFSSSVAGLADGQLWIGLVLTMLAAIVLGMGITTTAVYITLAVLVIPTLVDMGAPVMAAHLFALYFGVIANITPPVALAAYAAAGVAGSNPMGTGVTAFKLGISGFVVPFMFVYHPALLLEGDAVTIAIAIVTAVMGVVALGASMVGWLRGPLGPMARLVILAAAILLIAPGFLTNVVGALLLVAILILSGREGASRHRSGPGPQAVASAPEGGAP